MAKFVQRVEHRSGIPLGGIGTGTVEIRPDGYFHEWQMFNLGAWAPHQPKEQSVRQPEMSAGALAFYLWVQEAGTQKPAVMRRLGLREDQHNPYSFAYVHSPEAIEFDGRFPIARLKYLDSSLPLEVTGTFVSPLIPQDSQTSGTPGFYAIFRVRNAGSNAVRLTLASTLANPIARGSGARKLTNTLTDEDGCAWVQMGTTSDEKIPTNGTMCLGVKGGERSYVLGEYAPFMSHCWRGSQRYGATSESILHLLRPAGVLPNLPGNMDPTPLLLAHSAEEIGKLPMNKLRELLEQLLRYPSVRSVWDRVAAAEPRRIKSDAGIREFVQDVRQAVEAFEGKDGTRQTWGDIALASTITLQPLEEQEIVFVLAWHFPLHFSQRGPVLGHMYEHWFADAKAAGAFLMRGYREISSRAIAFADAMYDTTLPQEMADAWAGQLSTINKCTWWCKDGRFAVWEGLGCCGFHTTDITYQGSFNLLALWPDLQKSQMVLGAGFQQKDGFVHHMLWPDLSAVDEQFDRVDMNQQFVLLVARDYLWTGDREYLQKLWPNIVLAMQSTAGLDGNGDGLPDRNTRRNTYDNWDLRGTPAYIASLWLSALIAAVRLGEEMGEAKLVAQWKKTLEKGTKSFEKLLWNGRYYSLWVDGKVRDECCMTDQIDGEWFTSLVGLGHALPRKRIVAALQAILQHNFTPEQGLINASYPPAVTQYNLYTYNNAQGVATWTGIEYAIASMMIDFGMVAEGFAVVKSIHDRYANAGRFWNQMECGDHYYRAMSSWAVLLAATGFKLDAPAGRVSICPPARAGGNLRAPWFAPEGWGTFRYTGGGFALCCESGRLSVRELVLNLDQVDLEVELNGTPVEAAVSLHGGKLIVRFDSGFAVAAGDVLELGRMR